MKALLIMLSILASLSSHAKVIKHSTCEVGVSDFTTGVFFNLVVGEEYLEKLRDRGYFPYNTRYYPKVGGMYIKWETYCNDKWYGTKCDTKAVLMKRLANGHSTVLHTDKTSGKRNRLDRIFKRFPKCDF